MLTDTPTSTVLNQYYYGYDALGEVTPCTQSQPMKATLLYICVAIICSSLLGCASDDSRFLADKDEYRSIVYSKSVQSHHEVSRLTFENVEPDGRVKMRYHTDRIYQLHAKAGHALRLLNGDEVSDLRIKSASFDRQEVILLYKVKWHRRTLYGDSMGSGETGQGLHIDILAWVWEKANTLRMLRI